MIAVERVALVLLAAGRSLRFGAADKLSAPLDGLPLGLHAARTLAAMPFAARVAVIGPASLDYASHGFDVVANDDPGAGQARSLRLGVEAARRIACDAILIALADMPFLSREHVDALLQRHDGRASVTASSFGEAPMPPALFGSEWFERLSASRGDRGAGTLLGNAAIVTGYARELIDIDTPADLSAADRQAKI